MSVVKINAIQVPEGNGTALEERFASRSHDVDDQPGFEGFQLLRPVSGDERYFVVTTWASDADYQTWRTGQAGVHHGEGRPTVGARAELLEFEVVDL